MNKTLFMGTLKANYAMIIGFTAFTLIYVIVSIAMFEPQSTEIVDAMLTMLPEGMVKAFGFDKLTGELTTYLGSYLFGFILLVFPMICGILLANNLVVKLVDKGSMAYLLTSTNTRNKIITTQYLFLITGIAGIFVIDFLVTVLLSALVFPGVLNIWSYAMLNLVTLMASLVMGSIAFLISCIFNEARIAGAISGAIGGVFVIAHMVAGLGDQVAFLKYFTIYSFVDIDRSLNELAYVFSVSFIMVIICILLFVLAKTVFNRKSLTI